MNVRAVLCVLLLPAAALAGGSGMKPGTYEYTMKMDMPGMPFAMPPMTVQHCLTQADIDQGAQYRDQQNKDCEIRNLKQSPGKASMEFACKDGSTGTGEYSYGGDAMAGKTVMKKDGQTMTMNMSARRTGDCK